jgi:hypothetical protein
VFTRSWQVGGVALLAGACARAPVQPAPAPVVDPCGARLCEDFERYRAGDPPAGPWSVQASPGERVVVDGARAWSGSKSVLVRHTGTAHDFAYLQLGQPVLPLPGNDLHGRLMLFVSRVPPSLHWDNVRATGPRPDGHEAQYNVGGQKQKLLTNYEPHDCWRDSQLPFPTGRWVCLQWQFDGARAGADGGTRNELRVWFDGQPAADATVQRFGDGCVDHTRSEWIAPRFETLSIGWEQYRQSDVIEMWVDDIAIGDAPIACPAAPGR